ADTAFANFDMITYAKGNAVLRQLGIWLGDDFLRGVNAHLSGHPFGNADLADFLDALDGASDRDVRAWADAWLRTSGFDTIEVTRDGAAGGVPVLTRHGSRPHRFTVAAYDEAMRLVETVWVDLADEPVRLEQLAGLVVVPNAGDETFAAIRPDAWSWAAVSRGLSDVADDLTRGLLWWTAIDLAESGAMALPALVDLADRHLRPERHPVVFEAVGEAVLKVVRRAGHPDEVPAQLDVLASIAGEMLAVGDPLLDPAAARILATTSHDQDLLREWLGRDDVDQEVRWLVVRRLASLGDDSFIEAEAARDRSVAGGFALLRARAAVPTVEAKEEAWARLWSGTTTNHEFPLLSHGFWEIEQTELVRPWLTRYVTDALALAQRSGQGMGQVIGRSFPWLPHTEATRRELRDALAEALARDDVPTVLARWWNDQVDELDRRR
ncbi:MAG: M1 family metallopeptidase, partial [Nocardioides sp.]|nr:M1 family metallopeptidase [Nocardioides sp.]